MHDHDAQGNEYFKCDFCRSAWSEDRPMVEGHKGSLICGPCLALAYRAVVLGQAAPMEDHSSCAMCLMHKREPSWQSPMHPEAWVCRWCVEKAAGMLEKDPDSAWVRPTG